MGEVNGWWKAVAVGGMVALAACDDGAGAPGRGGLALTGAQLAERLEGGARLEVTLNADGSVREVEVEDEALGHADRVEGRALAFDAATGALTLEHLGRVDVAAAARFRDEGESHQDAEVWADDVGRALAAGEPVWVRADGRLMATSFAAADVRREGEAERPSIEADVTAADFDPVAGTLSIGGRVFDIGGASIHLEDDEGEDELEDDEGEGELEDASESEDESESESD